MRECVNMGVHVCVSGYEWVYAYCACVCHLCVCACIHACVCACCTWVCACVCACCAYVCAHCVVPVLCQSTASGVGPHVPPCLRETGSLTPSCVCEASEPTGFWGFCCLCCHLCQGPADGGSGVSTRSRYL